MTRLRVLLVTLGVLTFLDRIAISVAGPRMQQDLGLAPDQWGWVLGAFVLAYGLFEMPTGALGDRIGQRKVLARVVLWWSAFTALTGVVSGFAPLVAVRFLFGVGEAGAYPNIAGVIARWFPATERARTQGLVWAASRFGGVLAPLTVVPLQREFGWRAAFWIFGALGVVWTAAWWRWYRDPGAPPTVEKHEAPWGALLRSPRLWHIVVMYWLYAWGSWFYFSWLPTWLVKGRGFSESEMAIFASLPFLMGTLGNIAGGYLSDHLVARAGLRNGRRFVGAGALVCGSALLLATALTPSKTLAVALLSIGFGVMDLMLPSAWAVCLDIGGRHAGLVSGAMNTAGQLGGFVCTVIFGYIVRETGSYDAPLFVIAASVFIAALLFARIDASRPLLEPSIA